MGTVPLKTRFFTDPHKPDTDEARGIASALKYEGVSAIHQRQGNDDILFLANVIEDLCNRLDETERACAEQGATVDG